jgi:hypothetical protein
MIQGYCLVNFPISWENLVYRKYLNVLFLRQVFIMLILLLPLGDYYGYVTHTLFGYLK